jgi:glutaconate CoA-transferase, subunit B
VVTDLGLLEPDARGEFILVALHPGKTVEMARENTGWDLKVAESLHQTKEVEEGELRILREELDPTGIHSRGG